MCGAFLLFLGFQHLVNQYLMFNLWLLNFIIKGILAVIISIGILFLLFFKTPEYNYSISFVKGIIKKREP